MKKNYEITETLSYSHQDCGPWHSYEFNTHGSNLEEMIDNGSITRVDQDGGDLSCEDFQDFDGKSVSECFALIEKALKS